MKIIVKARPRAKEDTVEQLTQPSLNFDGAPEQLTYRVSVKASPVDGKANDAIVRLLAEHFGVARSSVRIVSGHTSKQKVVEIDA